VEAHERDTQIVLALAPPRAPATAAVVEEQMPAHV